MTTEIEICFPGEIQKKFQFCARTNTFITTVITSFQGRSSALLPYSQEFLCSHHCYRITGTGGAIGAAHTACAGRVRVSELHPVMYFLQTNTWEEEKGLRKSFVI